MTGTEGLSVDADARRATRRRRYRLRNELFTVSSLPRVSWCGRRRTGPLVTLYVGARGAGFGGVAFCSSLWACPVCSAVIRQRRSAELEAALVKHLDGGGGGMLVTLTIPHDFDDALETTLGLVRAGWAYLRRQHTAKAAWGRAGVVGYVKAVEITHGRNGWHPHLHVLVMTEAPLSADATADFRGVVEAAWVAGTTPAGRRAPSSEFGVDVRPLHVRGRLDRGAVARYLAKVQDGEGRARSPALELARGDLKTGRCRSSTPFELLAQLRDARQAGRNHQYRRLAALWGEYERVTHGRHGIVWSRGLKARLGVGEVTDEQLLEEALNEDARPLLYLDAWAWLAVCRSGSRSYVLDLAETASPAEVLAFVRGLVEQEHAAHEAAWEPEPPDHRIFDDDWWDEAA